MTTTKTFPPRVWITKSKHDGLETVWPQDYVDDPLWKKHIAKDLKRGSAYISTVEHLHLLRMAELKAKAETWIEATGLYSTYHDTDKHPFESDFAKRCVELATELRKEIE